MTKRILALLLVLLMVVPTAMAKELAPGVTLSDDGVLDIDFGLLAQYPLVTDGSVTLTIGVPRDDVYGIDADQIWWWNWWAKETGIKFEVEQVSKSALTERKNIMLASGDLPDILWGFNFTSEELVHYGDDEGLLLDMSQYITPEVMPNLSQFVEANWADTMNMISTPTGGVYTLPYYRADFAGYSADMYIDTNLLAATGLEIPTTLDDFTAMLREFKKQNPDLIPLSGGVKFQNPFYYILNAYGFVGQQGTNGELITVREGTPVIPANDPVFKEALATMKMYYDEGLISEDFFTTDSVTVNSKLMEGKLGTYGQKIGYVMADYDDFSHWVAVKPLTSAYNATQQWKAAGSVKVGGWVVSADTEYPELICRLADFFFCDYGIQYSKYGPFSNTEDTLGMTRGIAYDPEDTMRAASIRLDVTSGDYTLALEQEAKVTSGLLCVGNDAIDLDTGYYLYNWLKLSAGYEIDPSFNLYKKKFNERHIDNYHRISCDTNLYPYEIAGYPDICYFSVENTSRINELRSVIDPYIEAEVAKFITGARSLDEFDAFQSELDGLGIDELEGIYADYYASLAK